MKKRNCIQDLEVSSLTMEVGVEIIGPGLCLFLLNHSINISEL